MYPAITGSGSINLGISKEGIEGMK
ncbi:Protein of unknown function [Bacillus toyonensis]|nr:Protein of unknown function [Bacillus toyonensis]